jgi:hypothetical protein
MTFLEELLNSTKEVESPQSFWFWSGLVAISAIVKDNIWLSRGGHYNLYPNIYCILHADSGLKKGPPINLAKTLVKMVNNTRIISGRSSIQGILKELGTAETKPGGKINAKSNGFIVSSELSSSLVQDPAALTILTDLYDRNYNDGEWRSLLKMENFQLKDPTVTMFGGINDAHAESFFEKKDIRGGYYARTFIVHESEGQTVNSLARRLQNPLNKEKLAVYLKQIEKLNGPIKELADENNKLTEVGEYFDDWYIKFKRNLKESGVRDSTGTLNRFDDSVLKVAILLSLAQEPVLEIKLDALKQAIEVCQKLVGNVRRTTLKEGSKQLYADQKVLIIEELLRRDGNIISRAKLLEKYWMHFNADQLDQIMLSFDQAGQIKTESTGSMIVYRMPQIVANELKRFMEGK